jgi:putative heme-binding domain-containing protein
VPLATIGLLGIAVAALNWLAARGRPAASDPHRIDAATGRLIFFGKGNCSSCHTIGAGTGAHRGPPLGSGPAGPPIGQRAIARAARLSHARGRTVTAADYLVESLIQPGAYLVEGYRDEMPPAQLPPVQLRPAELKALILFLMDQGGRPDPRAIRIRDWELPSPSSGAATILGDAARGRELFFDPAGPAGCAACHRIDSRGASGTVLGPDLSRIGSIRPAEFLMESLRQPSARIAAGYATVALELRDGTVLVGVDRGADQNQFRLILYWDLAQAVASGQAAALTRVPRAQVLRRSVQPLSSMPGNYGELLTKEETQDLVAYLTSVQ